MLLALQELSGKSMTLYDALKAQFAKSSALQNSKSMEVCGKICFDPIGDGPAPMPEEPEPCCPQPKNVVLSIQEDKPPCCPDDCGHSNGCCKPGEVLTTVPK